MSILVLYLLANSIFPTVFCAILDAKKIFFNGVQGNITYTVKSEKSVSTSDLRRYGMSVRNMALLHRW